MVEISRLTDLIEQKDTQLDNGNQVNEQLIIHKIRRTEAFFQSTFQSSLKRVSENGTSKQLEDFKQRGEILRKEYTDRLGEIEANLSLLKQGETKAYQKIMTEFEKYMEEVDKEEIMLSPPKDIEHLQGNDRLKELEKYVYDFLGLERDTYKNGPGGQFIKGIVDEVIMGNADLLNQIYETNGAVLKDMVDVLLSFEGLKKIAEQLGMSIGDLFVGNAYEKGRSFGQLGLVTTGIGLTMSGGKLVFKGLKKTVGSTMIGAEILQGIETVVEPIRTKAKQLLGSMGKLEKFMTVSRTIEGGSKEALKRFETAMVINDKLLQGNQYAYMSSMATYVLLKDYYIKPGDLDVALNPKDMGKFVDKFMKEYPNTPGIKDVQMLEVVKGEKPKPIDLKDIGKIKQVAEEGRLNISYMADGIEVELFPEVGGTGLTNLGFMDKKVVNNKYTSDKHGEIVFPTLDPKGTAENYVINFLSEYGNNSLDKLGQEGLKLKDGKRINNMYLLLKQEQIVKNPDELLTFIDDTIKKYEALPKKGEYVGKAIDINNVIEARELLRKVVKDFKRDIAFNKSLGIDKPLLDISDFKKGIDKSRDEIVDLLKQVEGGDKSKFEQISQKIDDLKGYINSQRVRVINDDGFPHYYEYNNANKFIQDMGDKLKTLK